MSQEEKIRYIREHHGGADPRSKVPKSHIDIHYVSDTLRYEMCHGANKPAIAYEWSLYEPSTFGSG